MSHGALSPKQFNTESNMLEQGNDNEMMTRVRGIQNMTSNVYRPAFSSDYTTVHSAPSEDHSAGGVEQEEDDEA